MIIYSYEDIYEVKYMNLTEEQRTFIKKSIQGKKVNEKKMLSYLESHNLVDEEIFDECKSDDDHTVYFGYRFLRSNKERGFYPISVDTFIKRLPLFYDRDDRGMSLRKWVADLLETDSEGTVEQQTEEIYQLLEFFYFEAGVTVEEIMKYPSIQLYPEKRNRTQAGHFDISEILENAEAGMTDIKPKEFLMHWADYIRLCRELGWNDYYPERFITRYNEAREAICLDPIIYGYESESTRLSLVREGDIIRFFGNFPCDGMGRPIMKWIGIKVENVKSVTCNCIKSRRGELKIEILPDSMIYLLTYLDKGNNYTSVNDKDALLSWEQEYAGPLNMVFNHEVLKEYRTYKKMTQKEVADAVGTSVRTYQKWENGETKPDCQFLLRLMNWLEIDDVQYLISEKSISFNGE